MANLLTVPLGTLIDRSLREVRNQHEVGRAVVRGDAIDPTDTQFTLTMNGQANITDVLEFASELMLITGKSTDPNPVYTVIRGYFGTLPAIHPASQAGLLNPTFTRRAAADGVVRSLLAIEGSENLPLLKTESYMPVVDPFDLTLGQLVVELPDDTRDVFYVRMGLQTVPRWTFFDDVTELTYTTGKVLALPMGWDGAWPVTVTRVVPYRWSSYPNEPDEDDTVDLREGCEYLPSCYATAYLLSGREYSRMELDRSEEWNRSEPVRGGVSRSTVRDAWQSFYRKLDEARRLDVPLPTRPFVPWVR